MNNEYIQYESKAETREIRVNKDYTISLLSPKTYTCFVQSRGNYYFPVAFNVSKGHTRFRSCGTVPPIVSRSLPGTCFLFHFLSRLSSRSHPLPLYHSLFTCLFLSLPLSFPHSLPSPPPSRHHFYVCLPDGGRKRSRKFICRDVAPYSKTRMIYLHGAEGETGRDGFTRERFIERYAKGKTEGGNAKCIF